MQASLILMRSLQNQRDQKGVVLITTVDRKGAHSCPTLKRSCSVAANFGANSLELDDHRMSKTQVCDTALLCLVCIVTLTVDFTFRVNL